MLSTGDWLNGRQSTPLSYRQPSRKTWAEESQKLSIHPRFRLGQTSGKICPRWIVQKRFRQRSKLRKTDAVFCISRGVWLLGSCQFDKTITRGARCGCFFSDESSPKGKNGAHGGTRDSDADFKAAPKDRFKIAVWIGKRYWVRTLSIECTVLSRKQLTDWVDSRNFKEVNETSNGCNGNAEGRMLMHTKKFCNHSWGSTHQAKNLQCSHNKC